MCSDDRKVWSRDLERNKQPATLQNLMTWMTVEMKSHMQATAPLQTASATHYAAHYVNKANDEGKRTPNWIKCWMCKSMNNWPDQCQKLSTLNEDKRLETVKDNHACLAA